MIKHKNLYSDNYESSINLYSDNYESSLLSLCCKIVNLGVYNFLVIYLLTSIYHMASYEISSLDNGDMSAIHCLVLLAQEGLPRQIHNHDGTWNAAASDSWQMLWSRNRWQEKKEAQASEITITHLLVWQVP